MKDFKKYYILHESPDMVYKALTSPQILMLWTGAEAEMSTEPGSEFSLWNGDITGRNIEFTPDQKIVQEWYFGDQEQPSMVTIILHEHKQGTSVELRHTNIPDEDYDEMTAGWNEQYFGALIDFYESGS
jgi:uncharacterized protein YndB with AHSA1/START domain